MDKFEEHFILVKPIVLKCKRKYHIKIWELDDWLQEGRIVLYSLLYKHRDLINDKGRLLVYFKTKFTNYLKDVLREQESQKRQFHKMIYEEITEVAHSVPNKEMIQDEYLAFS
ncbi:hypothetical protein HMPREF9318_01197 [Streptococcus urinalis FB127-CNA-2]|uniref:Uncharacterized protein n=1 Tax=Streptococcus urinalis 2285-97 TaxID=764291 RepID=G5KI71_9STRE|nr:hypothetical protein STRUR_0359 [Streptococcus urinalis 2285-97]EKS19675.1 hypothetical protein HMPREF9318_01197 [Streptococcus urinalis FB127-CNA-2]VEF31252.1 Competence-specific sigma factor ComX [Streptococcus urinalis]